MKRILMLNYEFPPLGGGAGNATYYLLKEFAKSYDLEVDLVTSSTGEFRTEQFAPNIKIHFLDIGKRGNLHYQSIRDLLVYAFKCYRYCRILMRSKKFDLCHAFFGIPCGYIAMKLGIPYIVSLRGSDVPFYSARFFLADLILFRFISRKVWRRATDVVAVSENLSVLAKMTAPSIEIPVIYNGIDSTEFFPAASERDQGRITRLLFVGRLIPRKGLEYLLEAMKTILESGRKVSLLVVGEGPLLSELKASVSGDSRLDAGVSFAGRVSHDELPEIYRSADIFVIPSIREALGNVTHEALASGLPIVTTHTGAAELVQSNGLIVPARSSSELADAIMHLIDNPEMRESMSVTSRHISERMTWERTATSYRNIYDRI